MSQRQQIEYQYSATQHKQTNKQKKAKRMHLTRAPWVQKATAQRHKNQSL